MRWGGRPHDGRSYRPSVVGFLVVTKRWNITEVQLTQLLGILFIPLLVLSRIGENPPRCESCPRRACLPSAVGWGIDAYTLSVETRISTEIKQETLLLIQIQERGE